LYVNRIDGFLGTTLKKDEFICKCSSIDNVIVFLKNGNYLITEVDSKKYVGKNIIYLSKWKKNDQHMVYNCVYEDGNNKISYVKRFSVTSIIKDKIYNLTQGNANSKIIYFTANPNSESEIISLHLHPKAKTKNKNIEYDLSNLSIKGKSSKGNILTKHTIKKITQKSLGISTLGGRDIWIDVNIGRLNAEKRGDYLGRFNSDDKIIVFYFDGSFELTTFDLSNRYKMSDIFKIEKLEHDKIYTLLHQNGKSKKYYIKRFKIEIISIGKRYSLIFDFRGSKFISLTNKYFLDVSYNYRLKNGDKKNNIIKIDELIKIKSWKAMGNILANKKRMSAVCFINLNDKNNHEDFDNKNKSKDELTLF